MILVSACLLGCACRYDGQSKPHPLAQELAKRGLAEPVCPEQLGGLHHRAPAGGYQGCIAVLHRIGVPENGDARPLPGHPAGCAGLHQGILLTV